MVRVTPFRFGGPEQEKRQKSCAVPSRSDLQKPRQIRGYAVSALVNDRVEQRAEPIPRTGGQRLGRWLVDQSKRAVLLQNLSV